MKFHTFTQIIKIFKMKKHLFLFGIILSLIVISCDKEEVEEPTPVPSFVLGCTDENAENFNLDATDDNGSCTYSFSYLLDGEWNIELLEYATEVDLSQIDQSILPEEFQLVWPLIVGSLGSAGIEGEAEDAGAFQIESTDNTYNQVLVFDTEAGEIEIPIIGAQEIPSIPIDISSSGTWFLQNNDQTIVFRDSSTGSEQVYEILTLSSDFARLQGNLVVPLNLDGLFSIEVDLDLDLQLQKQ
tara:strand:- start:2209 stop:2934 length:726 start_codon:yes stop_codon:yes gene_type:complete